MTDDNYANGLPGIGRPVQPYSNEGVVPNGHAAATSTAAAAAAAVSAAARGDDPNVINLSKPMVTHQGNVSRLSIRTPNAGDYIDMGGYPFKARGVGSSNMELEIDFAKTAAWMARLTDVDEVLLRQLPQRDFIQGVEKVIAIVSAQGDDMGN